MKMEGEKKYSLIIHGGTGQWDRIPEIKSQKLLKICQIGEKILKNEQDPVKTVLKVIEEMENDPVFNAGIGSALCLNGKLEMDASIMVGNINSNFIKTGAVTCIKNTKNPIKIAFQVMEKSEYALLCGNGADIFAKAIGEEYENSKLITKHRKEERETILKKIKFDEEIKYPKIKKLIKEQPQLFFGTVGAVAFDGKKIVAGTSTGGHPYKMEGRVGDSAIIGHGTIANKNCGISITGFGEYSMKTNLSSNISTHYKIKGNFEESMEFGLKELTEIFGKNNTGIIGINKKGQIVTKFNTKKFGFAFCTDIEKAKSIIKEN